MACVFGSQLRRSAFCLALMGAAGAMADVHVPLALPAGGGAEVSPLFGDSTTTSYHPANVLVRYRSDVSAEAIEAANAKAGVQSVVWTYSVPGLKCVRVIPGEVDNAIASLMASGVVQYAERDHWRFAMAQSTPYGIPMVGAPAAWAASSSAGHKGAGARVAVLDTGVDLTHEDLPAPVLFQSFISGETVDDYHDHGTHCSGTVLALDNTLGVVGVAPEASLMTGKVLSNAGSGPTSGVMAGCDWASQNGANVISMSLGGGGENQAELDLYTAITANNVLIVAAAGNDNSATPSFPGSYPPVVCVAAVDSNRARASFSNFGPTVDISGPGVGVQSTIPDTTLAPVITWSDAGHAGTLLTGSAHGTVTSLVVDCGIGNVADFPPTVSGNIAHVRRRGTSAVTGQNMTFREKAENAIAAGAVGVIISNNAGGLYAGTLNVGVNVPVVGVSQTDGDFLQTAVNLTATINTDAPTTRATPYASFSGTSMATPHVAGVAGLLVGMYKPSTIPVATLRLALESTAEDLGDAGRDDLFGWGLVRADLAKAYLDTVITPSCPADFNHDGSVDPDDLGDYINCYFAIPPCADADFNGDGNVDPDDLGDYINAFFGGGC